MNSRRFMHIEPHRGDFTAFRLGQLRSLCADCYNRLDRNNAPRAPVYGEIRYLTYGLFNDRMAAIVWTPRGETRHIISMRKCNDREKALFQARLV